MVLSPSSPSLVRGWSVVLRVPGYDGIVVSFFRGDSESLFYEYVWMRTLIFLLLGRHRYD